jgi:cell division protein FtsB
MREIDMSSEDYQYNATQLGVIPTDVYKKLKKENVEIKETIKLIKGMAEQYPKEMKMLEAIEHMENMGIRLNSGKGPIAEKMKDLKCENEKLKAENERLNESFFKIMGAVEFAMGQDYPIEFWTEWNEGAFDVVKREWPEFDGYLGDKEQGE